MSRRRMFLVFTLITAVVGGMPAAGWSQTTSSSSSTSSSTTSSTTSSSTTTTTTASDPCLTTGGCTTAPPSGFIRVAGGGERPGVAGGGCWRQPPGSVPPGVFTCTTVLLAAPFPYEALVVRPGDQLTLRFDPALRPDGATITRSATYPPDTTEAVASPAGSTISFAADLPAGDHYLTARVTFAQGQGTYLFLVTVRPAPGPTPGPVRFTG